MVISQQKLHTLRIDHLKNLIDLEISFDRSAITAILGPNGNGKSTILHALACAFQPNSGGENYKFSSFFLPNPDALWNGSKFEITHSFREEKEPQDHVKSRYEKKTDRWSPKYDRRPKRDIFYIGIDKCVPLIESERKHSKINYSTRSISDDIIDNILSNASHVLNKNYSRYNIHTASGKEFVGVEVGNLKYSALSMSAGEQKVFFILEKIFKAGKFSLILIDELDLLLHDSAMKKLIEVIGKRASDKELQIIFTTHRESILELEESINIRHIVCRPEKSLCFNETKPDAINRLTGRQLRPIEVFVEDDLACAIVRKISAQLGGAKYVSIQEYGAASNCFTLIGGILLKGDNSDNFAFVLDGDVFLQEDEKRKQIQRVITGNDNQAEFYRKAALSKIYQFQLPDDTNPEKHIHNLIVSSEITNNSEFREIIDAAKEIVAVNDNHKFIADLIDRLGWERNVGLSKIMDLVSTTPSWNDFTAEIRDWLELKINSMSEKPGYTNQEHCSAKNQPKEIAP